MEFIQIILQNSNLKEAKLYGAAQKAATNPEIGITIQNKAAYHVIKDCSIIALQYLPHLVFGSYVNPFESLKNKFNKECIAEFVKQSETNTSLNQLMLIIISKAQRMNIIPSSFVSPSSAPKFDPRDVQMDDPYGDYGAQEAQSVSTPTAVILTPFEQICKAFSVM